MNTIEELTGTNEVKKKRKIRWKAPLFILLFIAICVLFYMYFLQIKRIPVGYVGVKSDIGSAINNSEDFNIQAVKGYIVYMPLYTELVLYPTTIQSANYNDIKVNAKDGTSFLLNTTVSYQLNEKKIGDFYRTSKKNFFDLNDTYLKDIVKSTYNATASLFESDSLISHRQDFDSALNKLLTKRLDELGLTLKNTVTEIEIPAEIKKIIDLKSEALQKAILAEGMQKQAAAESFVQITKAETARKEDSLKYSALTPLAVQQMFVEKWDGKLPVYGETPKIYKQINE